MQYIVHKGVMFVYDTTQNQPQQADWVATEGSTVAIKMAYVRDPCHPAKVTAAVKVDFCLDGRIIYSIVEDKYIPLVPEIRVLDPTAFLVNSATVHVSIRQVLIKGVYLMFYLYFRTMLCDAAGIN